jgi:chitin synthase
MARNEAPPPPLPYSAYTQASAVPQRQPTMTQRSGGTVKRAKTLTRPERHVAPVPLINPAQAGAAGAAADAKGWWTYTSWVVTFWAPPAVLKMCGIKEAQSRQAWREKITLVFIALVMGGFVGFATMGLQSVLCPGGSSNRALQLLGSTDGESTVPLGPLQQRPRHY